MMDLTPQADTLAAAASKAELLAVGVRIAYLGMLAVFFGLIALAVILPLLQKAVEPKKDRKAARKSGGDGAPPGLTSEEVAAVTAAIHAHFLQLDREYDWKMTWRDHEKPYSPWRLAGRAKLLLGRAGLRLRDRRV